MGTQQILLIVLSVIIVGVAIAVGISMFNNTAYNSNKTAVAADAQSYASQVVQYYKTPSSQGGANGVLAAGSEATIGAFIGWGADSTTNDNGAFTLSGVTDGAAGVVVITGVGTSVKDAKNPQIVATITFPAGTVTAVASDVAVP
ncbi:MAG: hypothetical protein CVU48_00180 [Candidatus Cloacimonetes bacterium HGW-Cloacimonetes-1]|jgi:hypothetical protein|nr:MAG: hypothetical protein CVU48_00180 [Candidatus Cloacimonetes bacterium HGW-Cloacimonetes-1]